MRPTRKVLKILSEKSKHNPKYEFSNLHRLLYDPDIYWQAYKNIYANKGSMTPGADGSTLSGMSQERINRIILSLRNHTYQATPARREYIAKKNNPAKKRPLGISAGNDKLLQEVVRMILEAIYEPGFSNCSHGFRPNRSCHTALQAIQHTFTGAKWFVEGDIKGCFDNIDHGVLIGILRRRIKDEYFIQIIWKFLKAGYLEQWEYHCTYSGTPQGSGVSPILANIYLSELDEFVANYAEKIYSHSHKYSPEYLRIRQKLYVLRKQNKERWDTFSESEKKERLAKEKALRRQQDETPPYVVKDEGFKTVKYVRYADDFIIGVIGSKADCETLKGELAKFLTERLKLTLSDEKTKITHSRKKALFLGYHITVSHDHKRKAETAAGKMVRTLTGKVRILMPRQKWVNKAIELGAVKIVKDPDGSEHWKAMPRGVLQNKEPIEIIRKYNDEIRGFYNYYAMAENVSKLNHFGSIMKYSMLKTLGSKYRCRVSHIKKKFNVDGQFGITYHTRDGPKVCRFYDQGFKRKTEPMKGQIDILDFLKRYDKPNSLAARIRNGVCELCGSKSNQLEFHQVKRLKDLGDDEEWKRVMKEKRRKTLVVCPGCRASIAGAHAAKS